jgi:hypothetical protein
MHLCFLNVHLRDVIPCCDGEFSRSTAGCPQHCSAASPCCLARLLIDIITMHGMYLYVVRGLCCGYVFLKELHQCFQAQNVAKGSGTTSARDALRLPQPMDLTKNKHLSAMRTVADIHIAQVPSTSAKWSATYSHPSRLTVTFVTVTSVFLCIPDGDLLE